MNIYTENQNDIIHETSVDFVLRPCTKEIHIVQYDKSLPVIKVELFRNGERYALPENAIVNVRVGKLDHTFVYEPVLGTNEERNIVYFEVSEQMATIPGRIWPVLEVIETNKVACSSPLCFIIERNPIQEGQIESEDHFPIIYELQTTIIDHETRIDTLESQIGGENIENGTGTNAIQMKQDGGSGVFSFTGKNLNATEIDASLTGDITYGATGNFATVVGGKASAQGKRSMAQGTTTIAKGNYSHAEGDNSVAYGNDSHAEGYATTAAGVASHSEGNNTVAGGELSHAEGFNTRATGQGAHAEGAHTKAIGNYSHSGGLNTEARYNGQTVIGHCNDNKESTVFEVGCGWTDGNGNVQTRRNAFEVYLDGHAEVLYVSNAENSIVNRKMLNNVIANINKKLEGKKSTIILNYNWDINYLKLIVSSGNVVDGSGNDISQAIKNGEYDNITIYNADFNSNEDKITPRVSPGSYYLILVPGRYGSIIPSAATNQYVLLNGVAAGNVIDPGSVILVTNTDVPDRWLAGYYEGFYALESRKYEVGATNLKNGRDTTISVQGGIDVIANYDGDIVFGTGLETTTENQAVFGTYNTVDWTYTNGRPLLTVGNGTSDARSTAFEVYLDGHAEVQVSGMTDKSVINRQALTNYVNSKLGIWVPVSAPVSTTITSARGKSWECHYQILKNTLTNKRKVEYTLYSLTEETATAELISVNLIATVTIGASYVTDTIGYANLPKPIDGDTYWALNGFTFDEMSDIGNQCTPLPFRGSGGFETRILVIDDTPPERITFKKVIANITLYEK